MSYKIYSPDKQANGAFDQGRIIEKKPLGFPQDGGAVKPYSNLFYWAHAWSEGGGFIAEHPHTGFEIMTYVLKGSIEHYDNKIKRWVSLDKGDLQVIKAGNGITHAERLLKDSAMFQIWFDPDLKQSTKKEAAYQDYRAIDFPVLQQNGNTIKQLVGNASKVKFDTEGVEISEYQLNEGRIELLLDKKKIYSAFLIEGEIEFRNSPIHKGDFFVLENENDVELIVNKESLLFVIDTPKNLVYNTYYEMITKN